MVSYSLILFYNVFVEVRLLLKVRYLKDLKAVINR